MAQTEEGKIKQVQTTYEKFGKDYYKRIGALGGKAEHTKPSYWQLHPEKASEAGRRGGKNRHVSKTTD